MYKRSDWVQRARPIIEQSRENVQVQSILISRLYERNDVCNTIRPNSRKGVVLQLEVHELLSRVKFWRHESTTQLPATQETLFAPVIRVQSCL